MKRTLAIAIAALLLLPATVGAKVFAHDIGKNEIFGVYKPGCIGQVSVTDRKPNAHRRITTWGGPDRSGPLGESYTAPLNLGYLRLTLNVLHMGDDATVTSHSQKRLRVEIETVC